MTYSMTGFSRVTQSNEIGTFTWEIRSVNSRYIEIHTRLPDSFRALDIELRSALKKQLSRGKVECQLKFERAAQGQAGINFNAELVQALTQACRGIDAITGNNSHLNPLQLLQYPGVIAESALDQDALDKQVMVLFHQGMQQLKENRQREGIELANTIRERLERIGEIVLMLRREMPEWVRLHFENTKQKALDLVDTLEPERLEQEVAILAAKVDVAEELDRLDVHVKETLKVLAENQPIGRRLDFLMQEFNREANTLSSKAVNQEITRNAVELKVLIEQMREQVQNIE